VKKCLADPLALQRGLRGEKKSERHTTERRTQPESQKLFRSGHCSKALVSASLTQVT